MKQNFNLETYRKDIQDQINTLTSKMELMNKDRRNNFWEIRDLEDEIEDLKLRLNPQFMCEYCWSDRHAYEVLRMVTPKMMVVRKLIPQRINVGEYWMSDAQDYSFTSNPDAPEVTLRLHKNGRWYTSGGSTPFGITKEPHEYYDYSF